MLYSGRAEVDEVITEIILWSDSGCGGLQAYSRIGGHGRLASRVDGDRGDDELKSSDIEEVEIL